MPAPPRNPLARQDAQLAFAESSLVQQTANIVQALLRTSKIKQKDLATRLGLTDGRISQLRSEPGNMTMKSLAAFCWAMGYHIELRPYRIQQVARRQRTAQKRIAESPDRPWEAFHELRHVEPSREPLHPTWVVAHNNGSFEKAS